MIVDGDFKDDVKFFDGEVGEKINKFFKEEEKDICKFCFGLLKLNKLGINFVFSCYCLDCYG